MQVNKQHCMSAEDAWRQPAGLLKTGNAHPQRAGVWEQQGSRHLAHAWLLKLPGILPTISAVLQSSYHQPLHTAIIIYAHASLMIDGRERVRLQGDLTAWKVWGIGCEQFW